HRRAARQIEHQPLPVKLDRCCRRYPHRLAEQRLHGCRPGVLSQKMRSDRWHSEEERRARDIASSQPAQKSSLTTSMHSHCASIFGTVVLSALLGSPANSGAAAPELKLVQNLKLPELQSVTSVVVSSDGKFAYTASFAANTICTFIRDLATGQLDLI